MEFLQLLVWDGFLPLIGRLMSLFFFSGKFSWILNISSLMLFSFSSSKTPAGTFNLLCIFSSVTFSLALFTFFYCFFFSHCPFSSFHLHLFSLRVPCDSVLISNKVLSFFIPLHFWVLLSLVLFYPSFISFTSGLTFPFAEQPYQPEKTQHLITDDVWCSL